MRLPRLSVERPVFATVLSLLLIVLGIGALSRLPVRELPDIDRPVVSVSTVYPGAAAGVVDQDVTDVIEDAAGTVEGITTIRSVSRDEVSVVILEFGLERDLDAAAADVRDAIARVARQLPELAEDPVIRKADADADPIVWLTLSSRSRDRLALTDYADRNLVDTLSIVPGVAQVIIGGERRYAMRIWLDRQALAAHGVTANDVVRSLREQNLELPAGRIEGEAREFTVRAVTRLSTPEQFRDLVLRVEDDVQITLGDVARVEVGAQSERSGLRIDGEDAVGLGVVRQSEANTLAVARAVEREVERLRAGLPPDMQLRVGFDASIFIEGAIREVLVTLAIAAVLVIAVIYLFLGSLRATVIPAATIPVSLLASFTVLDALGHSINTITLLALVLAIGLVVDDAIVVLENVDRRNQDGEPPLLAAARGADQVAFAVVVTTVVVIAVLVPLTFLTGDVGRLFTEFAAALAAAVGFTTLVALTLAPTLAARLVDARARSQGRLHRGMQRGFDRLSAGYRWLLGGLTRAPAIVLAATLVASGAAWWAYAALPKELVPVEDRGAIIIPIQAPQGASYAYTSQAVDRIEALLAPLAANDGPVQRVIAIVGLGRAGPGTVNEALAIVQLRHWDQRERVQAEIAQALLPDLLALPGVRAFAVNPPGLGQRGPREPVQVAVGGPDHATAHAWAQALLATVRDLPGLVNPQLDYQDTQPQVRLEVDRRAAADLGLTVREIGEALQALFSEQPVTDYVQESQSYDVIPRLEQRDRLTPEALEQVHVRARSGELVPLRGLVRLDTQGVPNELRRVNRSPSVTLSASLAPGAALGDVLARIETIARSELPAAARLEYLGQSQEYREASGSVFIAFALALVIVYLVLAAQFESFIHPIVIMLPVPLAVTGGLASLAVAGVSFNIYSQIALILLIGITTKNAVLLVEFANQLRDAGRPLAEAIVEAGTLRLRPVLMTNIATVFGGIPLAFSSGPGAEARIAIGVVIVGGVAVGTLITLAVVPGLYLLLARYTEPSGTIARRLRELEARFTDERR